MPPPPHPTFTTFQQTLTQAHVRALQLLALAFLGSASLMVFVVVFLFYATAPQDLNVVFEAGVLDFLTYLHLGFSVAVYALAVQGYGFLLHRLAGKAAASQLPQTASPAEHIVAQIRIAEILRLALLESAAIMGLVTCTMAAVSGALHVRPFYWFNISSAVFLIGYLITAFPSRAHIEAIFKRHWAQP